MIRVLLVDDHSLIRRELRNLLSSYERIRVVGEAGDGEEALMLAASLEPDVTLMDVNMPNLNGVEATKRLKTMQPQAVVIGISVNADEPMRQAMMAAGASKLLAKECAADDLYQVIAESHARAGTG